MKWVTGILLIAICGCAEAPVCRPDIQQRYTEDYIEQLRESNRALAKQVDTLAVENARMEVALEWYKLKK